MINFVDEVPDGEVLYHITETLDSQGNKAYRIELATEVTPGTPLNKVLFDSIKTDLTTLSNTKQDKLVTGSFTWSLTESVTINVGFRPKFVIAVSQLDTSTFSEEGFTAILLNNYGSMFSGGDSQVDDTYGRNFGNTFRNNGFDVPPYNLVVSGSSVSATLPATYVAFG